ncbi:MAG: tetratricopeptide repeat protein [Actinobacteria bacterium]|nr:tetratricopeptide repeat protein [Actinomycetota bacterium]
MTPRPSAPDPFANGALAGALHRPFLDLQAPRDGPLFSWAPVVTWTALERETAGPGMQRVLSTNFRINLLRQIDSHGLALHHPEEMDESRRTPQWSGFCELLRRHVCDRGALSGPTAVRLMQLCLYLGFHRYVCDVLPAPSPSECASRLEVATLAYQRAFARRMLHQDTMATYDPSDMELVAACSPAGSRVGFYAASAMVVHHAKTTGAVAAAQRFRDAMDDYVRMLARRADTLETMLDLSRYWRCVSFVPFLRGDRGRVEKELGRAETLAREAVRSTPAGSDEHLIALDNLHAVLESRMREALWSGDIALALNRISEVVTFDPLDAKAQIELGEVLLRAGHPGRAVAAFRAAARYGPPGTAAAHYLAGCCYQRLEMAEAALDEFLAAAALDPWSTNTAARLAETAAGLEIRPITTSARRCMRMTTEECPPSSSPVPLPYDPTGNVVYDLYRPFFDLGSSDDMTLASHGPLVAFEDMDGSIGLGLQHCYGERFRIGLLRESGLMWYAGTRPDDVREPFRTLKWQQLCTWVAEFPSLPPRTQTRLGRLLVALAFHRLVLHLCPPMPIEDMESAALALLRGFSEYTLKTESGLRAEHETLEQVVRLAPAASMVRHTAAMMLLTDAAKVRRDLHRAARYRAVAAGYLGGEPVEPEVDDFARAVLVSRFYRGASFVPYLAGDVKQVAAEMDLAEEVIRQAQPRSPTQAVLARESLFFVMESRMREALWRGDMELARLRAAEITTLDPWNAKAHIEHGEVLYKAGDLEGAAAEFQRAARLAPPGRAVALFLLGQCREALGDPGSACDAYLHALRADPRGVSTAAGVVRTASATGQSALRRWAERHLDEVVRAGSSPGRPLTGRQPA